MNRILLQKGGDKFGKGINSNKCAKKYKRKIKK